MKYRAGINTSADQAWGQVFDLPGCSVQGRDDASVEDVLPMAAAAHLAWLRGHGEDLAANGRVEIDVVERVDTATTDAQDGEFCYADDLRPLDDFELTQALRTMSYARADLLVAVDGLPDRILDWRPPVSAMGRVDPWQPQPLTIREIVSGIARSESYYRGCLRNGGLGQTSDIDATDLPLQRSLTVARLMELGAEERSTMFLPRTPWGERPEHWSARKVVRRIIGHERFHTAEIQQRLGWLLLGVPVFRP